MHTIAQSAASGAIVSSTRNNGCAMRVWEQNAVGLDSLKLVEKPEPKPGAGQIVVAMKAASLNYRDLLTIKMGGAPLPLIPFSDGAGVVEAVGSGVSRVKVGDRVCPTFFQSWIDGPIKAESRNLALGGSVPGVLQEKMLIDAEGVIAVPDHLPSRKRRRCLAPGSRPGAPSRWKRP